MAVSEAARSTTPNGRGDRGRYDLRAARKALGLSQQQLAARADCSLASVAILERGYEPEHSNVLGRIIAVLSHNDERPGTTPTARKTRSDGTDSAEA